MGFNHKIIKLFHTCMCSISNTMSFNSHDLARICKTNGIARSNEIVHVLNTFFPVNKESK